MTAQAVSGRSFKGIGVTDRALFFSWFWFVIALNLWLGLKEDNGMAIYGCIGAITCLLGSFTETRPFASDPRFFPRKFESRLQKWMVSVFLAFATAAPFVHVNTDSKIWFVNGESTLSRDVLIRLPFTPLATSINVKQNATVQVIVPLTGGTRAAAQVSGEFRVTGDEQELLNHFGLMKDPDGFTQATLRDVLRNAFVKAFANKTTADLAKFQNTFQLELDTGSLAEVRQLGVKRNGVVTVSDIHPYFVDR